MNRPLQRRLVTAAVLAAAHLGAAVTPAGAQAFDCLIEPNVTVAVAFPVEGQVETVAVDRGDLVRAGQVIATLEAAVERASVQVAGARAETEAAMKSNQVRLDFGVRRLVRTEEMYKQNLIPLKEFDEAETTKLLAEIGVFEARENRKIAELELGRMQEALAQRTLRSPIDAVVTERLLAPGEYARTAVVKLAQLDPLRVEVVLPVSQLGRISTGMRAEVTPEAPLNAAALAARVKVVDRVVDAASGTFGVRLELPNPDYRLPAGLKCKVRFLR